jgi:hypothetical protein
MGEVELDDVKMHQLSHRELFLSRQYETINASQIRCVLIVSIPKLMAQNVAPHGGELQKC